MSSVERSFITAVIDQDSADEYSSSSIRSHWFADPECRRAWGIITNHWLDHRETISRKFLAKHIPGFTFDQMSHAIPALVEMLEKKFLERRMLVLMDEASEDVGIDVKESLAALLSGLSTLQASTFRDMSADIAETIDEATARYHYRKEHKDALGLPWPWAPLQRSTNGARNGSYSLIYSRAKSLKTWVLLFVLKHWIYHKKRKALFITREMTKEEIQDRWLCLWAEVDYGRFEAGELGEAEEQLLEDAADMIGEIGGFFVENIEGYGSHAAKEIDALADNYDLQTGDVIAVDGMYFFAEDNQWQSFKSFSQGFKQLLLRKDRQCVGIATSQANRNFTEDINADAGNEMGSGDAPIQDCDLAMKLKHLPDDKLLRIMVNTLRRGVPVQFAIGAELCTNLSLRYSSDPDGKGSESDQAVVENAPIRGVSRLAGRKNVH